MNERNDYINELEKNNDELRKFKHDYKNLLLSLSASINDNDDDNLKNSIGKLLNYRQINLTDNDNRANLYKLKDKLVKGILITKLMQAKNKHIKTNFEIDYNATIPSNSSVDTTRILGILLDNAIDACMETDNPELDFAMVSFDKYIELIVKNNVKSNSSINTNDIYKSGYSTKKNHPGLGLASVREIVDSNSKFMIQVQNKDGYYLTILTISKGK
ncbi:sensor histidine kinase [Companilactobacillus muriivasis]|uniref:sensor histidine kinase n=1 Tax=Companilactobacillus muriivasis TaxID=3081444 RepID=UPI0030C6F4D9